MSVTERPGWAAAFPGEILGEDWRLRDSSKAGRWAIVWNANRGEVVAVEIVREDEAGRFLPLGTLPPGPARWGSGVPDLIRRAHDNAEALGHVAGLLQGVNERVVRDLLEEAASAENAAGPGGSEPRQR